MNFDQSRVGYHFKQICARPHDAQQEDAVREYIAEVIKANPRLTLDYYEPAATGPGKRVIVASKPPDPGMETKPTVILQAHLDMVCIPPDRIQFPLNLMTYKDQSGVEWLKAGGFTNEDGTTLGADDGIGVAAALAILEDTSLKSGRIECFFTVQEETDMGGAHYFDPQILSGRIFINLDAEDLTEITYGAAGGMFTTFHTDMPVRELQVGTTCIGIAISGLKGGHSGVNIHEGRANAIQLMARLLVELKKQGHCRYNIVKMNGGSKKNAIPDSITAWLAVREDDVPLLGSDIERIFSSLKSEYKIVEPGMKYELKRSAGERKCLDEASTDKLVGLLLAIPHGVFKMLAGNSPGTPQVVETSTNLAIIETSDNGNNQVSVTIRCCHRSAFSGALDWVRHIHEAIAAAFQIDIDPVTDDDWYPAWDPDEDSKLLALAREVYREKFGSKFTSTVIHAGLEPGYVVDKYRGDHPMDCISIGPTLKDPHTWNERLDTGSVMDFYDCLIRLLKAVNR